MVLQQKCFTEERRMRRWICAALLLGCVTASGCALPIYTAIPERRAEQLVYTSENLRLLLQEWERFWMVDQPDQAKFFCSCHNALVLLFITAMGGVCICQ